MTIDKPKSSLSNISTQPLFSDFEPQYSICELNSLYYGFTGVPSDPKKSLNDFDIQKLFHLGFYEYFFIKRKY